MAYLGTGSYNTAEFLMQIFFLDIGATQPNSIMIITSINPVAWVGRIALWYLHSVFPNCFFLH